MEWISVKDRLPNENTAVLVAIIDPILTKGHDLITAKIKNNKWVDLWSCEIIEDMDNLTFYTITHWMPLPATPSTPNQ